MACFFITINSSGEGFIYFVCFKEQGKKASIFIRVHNFFGPLNTNLK